MNEKDKLRVLLPHWIEHNQEHAQEFMDWIEKIGQTMIDEDVITDVQGAAKAMETVNAQLQAALEKLGGALEYSHDHSHTHEHHHHEYD
ncbi:MAG: hypothetical protein DRI56_02880 [Chloroflexota bacterium]|nr:MAG: hypothetical protein DRI56_02880 [Chloroflexota bacterium]